MAEKNEKDNLYVPRKSAGDRIYAVSQGIVGLFGSLAEKLFSEIVPPPLAKRRIAFFNELSERIRRLEKEKGIDLNELRENEVFIDIVCEASRVAIKTSSVEKREALRNAILNTACSTAPEDFLQHMFIRLIDEFNEWHIRVLKFFDNPAEWFRDNGVKKPDFHTASLADILEKAYPELKSRQPLYDLIWKDLHRNGLVITDNLNAMQDAISLYFRRLSDFGKQFLEYITTDDE